MVNRARPRVQVTVGVYRGEELLRRDTIAQNVVKIGRDPRSHVRIDEEAAARVHAILEVVSPSEIVLLDLGQSGGAGTVVRGQRVDKCRVSVGEPLRIGGTTLVVEDVSPLPEQVEGIEALFDGTLHGAAYRLSAAGPAVDPDDVETRRMAVEVTVLWGTTPMDVVHLSPPRAFFVGDDGRDRTCDCLVPSAALGTPRAPLIVTSALGDVSLVLWPGADGTVDLPGEGARTFAEVVASGRARPSAAMEGAYEVPLVESARALVQVGLSISFRVQAVRAGKRVPPPAVTDPETLAYTGASFLVHAGLFAALAFFMPPMNADAAEAFDRDRVLAMQRLLNAAAEREREAIEEPAPDATAAPSSGSPGAAARGDSGAMGTPTTRETGHRYAVQGPKDNPDPHLAKVAILSEAAMFGLAGALPATWASDPNAPTASWGRDDSAGKDDVSARGTMFGATIDDAAGPGGLGPSGTGSGGGGDDIGVIGVHDIGGLDHGAGTGGPDGIGRGHDRGHRGHLARQVRMREAVTTVNGKLPAEVIQRIVRENFGRFRYCYEKGLRADPSLRGRVAVKFGIDRTGGVGIAVDGGSDLPDQDVVRCVVTGFANLSFPPPEGGVVTVVYPILFTPGD